MNPRITELLSLILKEIQDAHGKGLEEGALIVERLEASKLCPTTPASALTMASNKIRDKMAGLKVAK